MTSPLGDTRRRSLHPGVYFGGQPRQSRPIIKLCRCARRQWSRLSSNLRLRAICSSRYCPILFTICALGILGPKKCRWHAGLGSSNLEQVPLLGAFLVPSGIVGAPVAALFISSWPICLPSLAVFLHRLTPARLAMWGSWIWRRQFQSPALADNGLPRFCVGFGFARKVVMSSSG